MSWETSLELGKGWESPQDPPECPLEVLREQRLHNQPSLGSGLQGSGAPWAVTHPQPRHLPSFARPPRDAQVPNLLPLLLLYTDPVSPEGDVTGLPGQ